MIPTFAGFITTALFGETALKTGHIAVTRAHPGWTENQGIQQYCQNVTHGAASSLYDDASSCSVMYAGAYFHNTL
jgi:hypothetical protein